MERYVCIHGHFYQPPRENPWLEDIELQDTAYPYHDWNARISQECYRQNGSSRILGHDRKIIDIVNNYANISFNFGPTLLSWLQRNEPDVYEKIIEADKASAEKHSGHGSAIAQAYNHMIMPLANERDKETQVLWGISDFEQRFGRRPEGMWLPETAVDTATLKVLAAHGIKFTILAPRQAKQIRKTGQSEWTSMDEAGLNPRMPYLCNLPSGKSIALFFYDGPVSHDIAYGGLLHSGEAFAGRLTGAFAGKDSEPQCVNMATDGESFGHHHRHGDMALAYCLHHIVTNDLAKITVFGEFLEKFPPTHEVQVHDNSSWSCAHGVERWRSNCGCAADPAASGKQQWRGPLRQAFDWLRDELARIYEEKMQGLNADPWKTRNEYIAVINDRSADNVAKFIKQTAGKDPAGEDKTRFLKLLEMQRNAMLMYTSCGWFFDNLSGIETVQVLQYAARAIQLAYDVSGQQLEEQFKERLSAAPANVRRFGDGRGVYEKLVQPGRVDLHRVGAHFALSSLFTEQPREESDIYCYSTKVQDYQRIEAGVQKLATGRATIRSNIVLDEGQVDFAVMHLGDHNLTGAVTGRMDGDRFEQMRQRLEDALRKGDTTEIIRIMDVSFSGNNYSLWHLFKDEQRRILYEILGTTWQEIEASFRHIYEHNYTIMQMMRGMNMPLPRALSGPAEFILNRDLTDAMSAAQVDLERLQALSEEAERLSLNLDQTTLKFAAATTITRMMNRLGEKPEDVQLAGTVDRTLRIIGTILSDLDLQAAQNIFFDISRQKYDGMKTKADQGDEDAKKWIGHIQSLAQSLEVVVP